VCQADGLHTDQLAAEGVQFESRRERVLAELIQGIVQQWTEIGVLTEKPAGASLEMLGGDQRKGDVLRVQS